MITEDYVSFETAKLLKEKGFNEPCVYVYCHDSSEDIWDADKEDIACQKPTLQMAMKWLREKHNLFIQITVDFSDGAYPMYDACVVDLARCISITVIGYDRYYYTQACETAIKYCLENLI